MPSPCGSEEVRYLTDGVRLYEIVSEYIVRNYGLAGSFLRGVTVQDCLSGEWTVFPASRLLDLQVVA